jgi:uncharacterized coiled-coil DUF342 family protein
MDDLQFRDTRLRISRWIEDTSSVFAAILAMLQEHGRVRERLDATERAAARLLQEVNDLRRELDALQSADVRAEGLNRVLQDAIGRLRAPAARPDPAREPSLT